MKKSLCRGVVREILQIPTHLQFLIPSNGWYNDPCIPRSTWEQNGNSGRFAICKFWITARPHFFVEDNPYEWLFHCCYVGVLHHQSQLSQRKIRQQKGPSVNRNRPYAIGHLFKHPFTSQTRPSSFQKVEHDRLPSKKMTERWLIPWWFMMIPWWFQFSAHSTEFPWTQISQRLRSIYFSNPTADPKITSTNKKSTKHPSHPHPTQKLKITSITSITSFPSYQFEALIIMKQLTATLALSVKTLALDHHHRNLPRGLEVVGKMKHFRFSIDEIFINIPCWFKGKKHSVTITFRFKQGFP